MEEQNKGIPLNTGFIADEPISTDLFFGSNNRVEHIIKLLDRNWLPHYSNGESQIGKYYDTMGCVSFSAHKIVEALFNYLISINFFSKENVDWLRTKGYIVNGKVNFSDRFLTAMSGTTDQGNTGSKVWWTLRNKGAVPEAMCSWNASADVEMKLRFGDWFRNPDNISDEAKALGLEFVKRFDIFYERLPINSYNIRKGLLRSPIQVYIPTGCHVKDTVQQYCDGVIGHAVSMCDDTEPRGYYPLFDHYVRQWNEEGQERWIRRVVKEYKFYPTGYVCSVKEKDEPKQENMATLLRNPDTGAIYAVFADKTKQHITSMEGLNMGVVKGLWVAKWADVPQAEIDKYPNTGNPLGFMV